MKNNKFCAFLCSGLGKLCTMLVLYVIIFSLLLGIVWLDLPSFLLFVYVALYVFFGWKALNKITPDIFLIMPIGGWIIYYVIKFILSVIVGVFVAPYVIAEKISSAIQRTAEDLKDDEK